MSSYTFSTLESVSIEALTDCFNLAFSDYAVPTHITPEQNERRLKRIGADFSMSCGAFCEGELVGFIIAAVGEYSGCATAFDAATGIAPAHRGAKLFGEMFSRCCDLLSSKGINSFMLEVLKDNGRAIKLYKQNGFEATRELIWFTQRNESKAESHGVACEKLTDTLLGECARLGVSLPSFENRNEALFQDMSGLFASYAKKGSTITAMCIYDERGIVYRTGRLSDEEASLAEVLNAVHRECGALTVSNADASDSALLRLFDSMGLEVYASQYEMRAACITKTPDLT